MGRPKSANPKNRHIGIVTTEEKYRRFKRLNLVGDRAIDVLLYYLEKDNQKLQLEKVLLVENIKKIDKEIKELEYKRLEFETELEEVNKRIGFVEAGMTNDVEKAVGNILQRYNSQSVYNIKEFLEFNKNLLENQAYLCGLSKGRLYQIVFDKVEEEGL
ncbi:MAG: hypothetical protein IJI96_03520 [Methanobrevibacter sp.]|nr:hypothetical protein [Methanobrevibacter sp.]